MKYIGKMEPFYRNQAVLSEKMFLGGLELGGELSRVPDYLLDNDIDFPYINKKPTDKELLFTDHISLVRFLGGVGDKAFLPESLKGGKLDLAYRDDDGCIRIRESLIERYRPFVELYGKEITVVLDNIPWAFVSNEVVDNYGQINPPEDYEEWRHFIKDMCKALIENFRFDTVNSWRFRIGTESRINVDTVDYCKHYDITTAAIKEILPGAKFGPYNQAGVGSDLGLRRINMFSIARHCAEGTNLATGEKGSPFDFAAVSYYSIPKIDKNGELRSSSISPVERIIKGYVPYWDHISSILGEQKYIPREIHECGILTNEYNRATSEPGARGAAWLFQFMFEMREKANVSKIWHWHTTDVVKVSGKSVDEYKRVLRSNAWLFSILDHLSGLDAYVLNMKAANPCADNILFKAVGFLGSKNYIVCSGFNVNRNIKYDGYVYIDIPRNVLDGKPKMKYAYLSDENDVYQAVYKDLKEINGLATKLPKSVDISKWEEYETEFYDEHIVHIPGTSYPLYNMWDNYMVTEGGMDYIDSNWSRYEKIIKDSLTLKVFEPAVYEDGEYSRIFFRLTTPMTVVIQIDKG